MVLSAALSEPSVEAVLVAFMLGTSLLLVAVAFERAFMVLRVRMAIGSAGRVVSAARSSLADAGEAADRMSGPVAAIFTAPLDRALGELRGDPVRAVAREQKRLTAALKSRMWILATAGALMPFVGLFGTVLGVMESFQAIGETGQGGFAVVSVGISQALIATAVGIAVALEGVVLFNVLQAMSQRYLGRLALLSDELLELIDVDGQDDGEEAAKAPAKVKQEPKTREPKAREPKAREPETKEPEARQEPKIGPESTNQSAPVDGEAHGDTSTKEGANGGDRSEG